jgi:CheY-like chemotaxis protein
MTEAKTILVVDDDRLSRKLVKTLLEGNGYTVTSADSGGAALAALAQSPPSLMVLDLMMPDMDGFEVLRRLRSDTATRDLPVLLVTALDQADVRARLVNAGTVEIITKPLDRWRLAASLARLLGDRTDAR